MKTLYLDLGMGAAGDMISAALYELLDDENKKTYLATVNSLGLDGVVVTADKCSKCGISGTKITVRIHGMTEDDHHSPHAHEHGHEHDHENTHEHAHEHTHSHAHPDDIEHIISHLPVSDTVKENAGKIYDIIADAESRAHGTKVSEIHFHEVGQKDAITDVVSACLLLEMLEPEKVIATPVCTGYGSVRCAHGIMPVPAPATAYILEGIPMYAGVFEGEMCTPTGAAIIKHFADKFCTMPVFTSEKTGYGMGTKDFDAPNCVRAMLGNTDEGTRQVVELSCNVDDMTGEAIGYATDLLFSEGALDVYTVPVGMKKSRPGTMINVICKADDCDRFATLMLMNTTTIGVRKKEYERYTLDRKTEMFDSTYGTVKIKTSEGYGIKRMKPEYEDVAKAAKENRVSFQKAFELISREIDERKNKD